MKRDAFEKAISHYEAAIKLKTDYADAFYNLAIVQVQMNKLSEAKSNLKKALELQPTHANAHGQLAKILQKEHKEQEALTHYQERIKLEPQDVDSYINIGAILVKQGNLKESVDYFHKALEIDPHHPEALFNLGSTYFNMNDIDQALPYYLQALTYNPDPDIFFNVGVIYMYKERHQDAIDYFSQAIAKDADYVEAHINLATTYLKIEKYEQAISHYQKVLELQPNNIEVEYILKALLPATSSMPKHAPLKFVKNLFDQYAPHFEKHLLKFLNYQAHLKLYQACVNVINLKDDLVIVDLGCGTGLCGELFRKNAKKLIGIDISENMITIAKEKNIYDELITSDMTAALKKLKHIDLILAADVFGYIGDLSEVFNASYDALKEHGYLAFTVEKGEHHDYELQKSTRYAHSRSYIEHLAKQCHFKVIKTLESEIRKQRQTPVMGYIFLLEKQL
jgi:predicted TPR repeat methyltransferase